MVDIETDPKPLMKEKHARQMSKTEMCKYFAANCCTRGMQCGFAHSVEELREKPNLDRTSMCRVFLRTGNCKDPFCKFAHREQELRNTCGFFKTRMCVFASTGRCRHGAQCRYAHHESELNVDLVANAADARFAGKKDSDSDASEDTGGSVSYKKGETIDDDVGVHSDTSTRPATYSGSGSSDGFSTHEPGAKEALFMVRSDNTWTTASSVSGYEDSLSASSISPSRSVRGKHFQSGGQDSNGDNSPSRSKKQCTTVMLDNVPVFLTQGAIISQIEDVSDDFKGSFDFFFCPWDPSRGQNLGYIIINFYESSTAAAFTRRWSNRPLLPGAHNAKPLRVVPAALQGRATNISRFSGFPLANHPDARFRPLVRAAPDEELRPMAIAKELICNKSYSAWSAPSSSPFEAQYLQAPPAEAHHRAPHSRQSQQQMQQKHENQQRQQKQQKQQNRRRQQQQQLPQGRYIFGNGVGVSLPVWLQIHGAPDGVPRVGLSGMNETPHPRLPPEGPALVLGADTQDMNSYSPFKRLAPARVVSTLNTECESPLTRAVPAKVAAPVFMGMESTWGPDHSSPLQSQAAMHLGGLQEFQGQGSCAGPQLDGHHWGAAPSDDS